MYTCQHLCVYDLHTLYYAAYDDIHCVSDAVSPAVGEDVEIGPVNVTLDPESLIGFVSITTIPDGIYEADEQFTVRIVDAVGAEINPDSDTFTFTIIDQSCERFKVLELVLQISGSYAFSLCGWLTL